MFWPGVHRDVLDGRRTLAVHRNLLDVVARDAATSSGPYVSTAGCT